MTELASYGVDFKTSRGRLHDENEDIVRSPFRRDCDRIIHSTAFRRLEYKTQVFVNHEGDHYRTRLTHTLEVAQVARALCRELKLDEDLGEGLALAHDLGHPPFGHSGEFALNELMEPYGGFDHNAQTLKILTTLEQRYAAFIGLNLTWETLEGVVKHNGPVKRPHSSILAYNLEHDLMLKSYPSLEAQVAAIADDIAYNNHDIDDGIRAGLITVADIRTLPFLNDVCEEVIRLHGSVADTILIYEMTRRMIHRMIRDVIETTLANIEKLGVHSVEDVRNAGARIVCFSPAMEAEHQQMKSFLMDNMYMNERVQSAMNATQFGVKTLFTRYMNDINQLPIEWKVRAESDSSDVHRAITICDFIAGMTDRYAIDLCL